MAELFEDGTSVIHVKVFYKGIILNIHFIFSYQYDNFEMFSVFYHLQPLIQQEL